MLSVVQILLSILPAIPVRAWSQTEGKAGSEVECIGLIAAVLIVPSAAPVSQQILQSSWVSHFAWDSGHPKNLNRKNVVFPDPEKICKISSQYIGRLFQTQPGPSFFFMLVFLPVLLILFYLTSNRSGREILYVYRFYSKQDTCKSVGCRRVNRAPLKSAGSTEILLEPILFC